ncbi:MAG: hypothetical protein H3C47_11050 [Candidatus Cloacimonetes bacterium]|nr:hypothetical protein [Candidatus Cloacimonadota bacterium]
MAFPILHKIHTVPDTACMLRKILELLCLGPGALLLANEPKSNLPPPLKRLKLINRPAISDKPKAPEQRQEETFNLCMKKIQSGTSDLEKKQLLNKALLALRKADSFTDPLAEERRLNRIRLGLSCCLKYDVREHALYFANAARGLKQKNTEITLMLAELAYREGDKKLVRDLLQTISIRDIKSQKELAESWRLWGNNA